jgi:hypothetical protein
MAITILLILVVAALLYDAYQVRRLRVSVEENTAETKSLRLKSRARIATASVQSGAVSEEQQLRRLGRASQARRIVVGGDDDSQLNQELNQQLGGEGGDNAR